MKKQLCLLPSYLVLLHGKHSQLHPSYSCVNKDISTALLSVTNLASHKSVPSPLYTTVQGTRILSSFAAGPSNYGCGLWNTGWGQFSNLSWTVMRITPRTGPSHTFIFKIKFYPTFCLPRGLLSDLQQIMCPPNRKFCYWQGRDGERKRTAYSSGTRVGRSSPLLDLQNIHWKVLLCR